MQYLHKWSSLPKIFQAGKRADSPKKTIGQFAVTYANIYKLNAVLVIKISIKALNISQSTDTNQFAYL